MGFSVCSGVAKACLVSHLALDQEMTSMRKLCEMLGMNRPKLHVEACEVAARMSATMAEAVFTTVLGSKKLTRSQQEEHIQNSLSRLTSQSEAYSLDVRGMVNTVVLNKGVGLLLRT